MVILGALALFELVTFLWKGVFAIVMSRAWALHGLFSVLYLGWVFCDVAVRDVRRGRFWFLLPLGLAVPLCFWNIRGFGALNTESLSELQHGLERLREPGWGYMEVFWQAYPSRMFLVNLVPTLLSHATPEAYRLGFSLPVFAGVLFFYSGLRRYFGQSASAAPVSAVCTAVTLAFPVVVWVTRTFEMAVSSFAIGLWACGALLVCAARPNVPSALAAAWTGGLLAATFTPGVALVGLLIIALGLWLVRSLRRRQRHLAIMVGALSCYQLVFAFTMYTVRENTFRARQADLSQMMSMFLSALRMVFSEVFTPKVLILPLVAAIGFALSGRAGLLALSGVVWCVPVIWACVNLHGKIAPQLPFVLYRAIVVVPVLAYVMATAGLALAGDGGPGRRWLARVISLAVAGGLVWSAVAAYRSYKVFDPVRPPEADELVILRLMQRLPEVGLAHGSEAVLLERTDLYKFQRVPALSWYFLDGWTRPQQKEAPLWIYDQRSRLPGIIFVRPDNPLVNESPPGYAVRALRFGGPDDPSITPEIIGLVYLPTQIEASHMTKSPGTVESSGSRNLAAPGGKSSPRPGAPQPPQATLPSIRSEKPRIGGMTIESVTQGWGTPQLDLNVMGRPLSIAGESYLSGIGTHAVSRIEISFPPRFKTFSGACGVDGFVETRGSIVCKVADRDKILFTSPLLRGGMKAVSFRVSVKALSKLTLLVDDGGDGINSDHANWVDLQLR